MILTPTGNNTKGLVRTVYKDQTKILQGIIKLYCPGGFDVDPTYGGGQFYKKIPLPKYAFDIKPRHAGVKKADFTNLPLKDSSVNSVLFDPPFLMGVPASSKSSNGVMKNRFGTYQKYKDLKKSYLGALRCFYRILKREGYLTFKCQDTVDGGRQRWSHLFIISQAMKMGFDLRDLFILTADQRMETNKIKQQVHARKYHSYFLVFQKI